MQIQWIEATISRLYYGDIGSVLKSLSRLIPPNEEAKEGIRKLKGYLNRNRDRINYSSVSRSQMPIGSGGIESANKFICHIRLKRSGAWWYKINGNTMLKLRCSMVNNTFDDVFGKYKNMQKSGAIMPRKKGKK